MIVVPSASDCLVLYGDFLNFTPEELFDHWVKPELLLLWWPKDVELDAVVGGMYRFGWPEQDWVLRGRYEAFEPGRRLRFTWHWDQHPADIDPMWVDVFFMPIDRGVRLSIFHGPYSESASDQGAKQGHLEGWIHFGMRLAGLRPGEVV
ncbi:MAG: SRPBCC domain-containing protein [Fimbriimonas sp.]|nr:SRPBCC domain-containing protein [Fimbriimonas sp.]